MQKFRLMVLCFMVAMILSSCLKYMDFTPADKNYVFTIADIKGLDFQSYKIKRYNNGREYYFSKDVNRLHGLYGNYGVTLFDKNNQEIHLKAHFSIQKSKAGAVKLYESQFNMLNATWKKHIFQAAGNYGADQAAYYQMLDHIIFILQKNNLYYMVDFDGVLIQEIQIRDTLKAKVDYIIKNGVDGFTVESF